MGIVCCGLVGSSQSGKTTLAAALVARLTAEGLAVGYLKHAHAAAQIDRPGSDSDRLFQAGAAEVTVADPTQVLHRRAGSGDLAALLVGFRDVDVVLAEGFSAETHPKIRVTRSGEPPRPVADPVILELTSDGAAWPADAVDAAAAAVHGLIAAAGQVPSVSVVADGVPVAMHRFASQIVAGSVLGTVSALKGVDQPRSLTVTVRLPEG